KRHRIDVEQSRERRRLQRVDGVAEIFVAQAERERQRIVDAPAVLREVGLAEQERIVARAAKVSLRAAAGTGKVVDEITERRETAARAERQQTTFDNRRELARSLFE